MAAAVAGGVGGSVVAGNRWSVAGGGWPMAGGRWPVAKKDYSGAFVGLKLETPRPKSSMYATVSSPTCSQD